MVAMLQGHSATFDRCIKMSICDAQLKGIIGGERKTKTYRSGGRY